MWRFSVLLRFKFFIQWKKLFHTSTNLPKVNNCISPSNFATFHSVLHNLARFPFLPPHLLPHNYCTPVSVPLCTALSLMLISLIISPGLVVSRSELQFAHSLDRATARKSRRVTIMFDCNTALSAASTCLRSLPQLHGLRFHLHNLIENYHITGLLVDVLT